MKKQTVLITVVHSVFLPCPSRELFLDFRAHAKRPANLSNSKFDESRSTVVKESSYSSYHDLSFGSG